MTGNYSSDIRVTYPGHCDIAAHYYTFFVMVVNRQVCLQKVENNCSNSFCCPQICSRGETASHTWSNPEPTSNVTSRSLPPTVAQELSRAPAAGREEGCRF
jgi:hypothetical protein